MPFETRKSAQLLMSFTPFARRGPLSRFTDFLPKPDEPRTFGANTPMPCESSAW